MKGNKNLECWINFKYQPKKGNTKMIPLGNTMALQSSIFVSNYMIELLHSEKVYIQ